MYGFLDECGDTGYKEGSTRYFLTAVVLLADRPDRLRKAVAHVRRGLGKKLRNIPEFKGTQTEERIKRKLIEQAQRRAEFEVVAAVLDKRKIPKPVATEELYQDACRQVLRRCFEEGNNLNLVIDKRYTNPNMRQELTELLLDEASRLRKTLSVKHRESEKDQALQIADVMASAVFQKYEHGREDLFAMIAHQAVVITK